MSTVKILQKPVILELIGSTLRMKHPDLTNRPKTALADGIAAAGTSMSVYDNNALADDDWMLIGTIGDSQSEEVDVNGAVTRGQALTVTNTLKFSHELDAQVTKIQERGIKIYGATTDGGSGTLIASVDAITTPIADAVMIQWNRPHTEYSLISSDTTYAYYFIKYTDGTTDSDASDYIPSTGWPYNAAVTLIRQALDSTNTDIDGRKFTYEMLVNWVQDWQDEVSQYTYQDARSGMYIKKDWNHEITEDLSTITLSQNEDEYDLVTLLSTDLKYIDSGRAVINVQIGDKEPLEYFEFDEFVRLMQDKHRTEVATQAVATDTTLTVDSTAGFPSTGTLLVEGDTLTYTAITSTTFTGIPASGTGSITATHEVDDAVWNNISQGIATVYTMLRGNLRLNLPPSSTLEGYPLKIRYYKKLSRITEPSDTTVIPFTNVGVKYLKARIEERKGNIDKSAKYQADFMAAMIQNAMADSQPLTQAYTYYNFNDPDDDIRWSQDD